MATKKLSIALKALLTPEFGAKVEMPSLSLNGTEVTASGTELNYVDGVTSAVQTQIDSKAASVHNHNASAINAGTLDGDRLPAMSATKKGAVPLTGSPTGKLLQDDNTWVSKNTVYTAFYSLTYASPTTTWTISNGYNARLTLTGSVILDIVGESNGMTGCLIVTQGGVGGWTLTLPGNSYIIGGDPLTLSSAPGSIDILTVVYDGTNYYWSVGNNYCAP